MVNPDAAGDVAAAEPDDGDAVAVEPEEPHRCWSDPVAVGGVRFGMMGRGLVFAPTPRASRAPPQACPSLWKALAAASPASSCQQTVHPSVDSVLTFTHAHTHSHEEYTFTLTPRW